MSILYNDFVFVLVLEMYRQHYYSDRYLFLWILLDIFAAITLSGLMVRIYIYIVDHSELYC